VTVYGILEGVFHSAPANLEQGVRAYMQQSRVFVGMVLILIFAEVLGLYGYEISITTISHQMGPCLSVTALY